MHQLAVVLEDIAKQRLAAKQAGTVSIAAYEDLVKKYTELESIVNDPRIDVFIDALRIEISHQNTRWEDNWKRFGYDWHGLVSYLSAKAVMNPGEAEKGQKALEKRLHRIITIAAAAANWYAAEKASGGLPRNG